MLRNTNQKNIWHPPVKVWMMILTLMISISLFAEGIDVQKTVGKDHTVVTSNEGQLDINYMNQVRAAQYRASHSPARDRSQTRSRYEFLQQLQTQNKHLQGKANQGWSRSSQYDPFPNKTRNHKQFLRLGQQLFNNGREVIYNSGAMAYTPDSLYFNFETGMNGSDTAGMDVMISQNEGTNFGSEGAGIDGTNYPGFDDPSLLHFLSPDSTISTITSVPDTNPDWATISWYWNEHGNGGQPLTIGNVWVVYTRTTNCYAVLEVTDVDTWGGYFAFNYMYQSDGSPVFDGSVTPIDITINGLDADTVAMGDSITIEISFSSIDTEADVFTYVDMNNNGVLDPDDMEVEDGGHIVDNEEEDMNPATGIYEVTFETGGEGPFGVSNLGLLIEVVDAGGSDVAGLYIEPTVTAYSISGSVDPVYENIIIIAENSRWMGPDSNHRQDPEVYLTTTDGAGVFQVFLPDTGLYNLMAFDFLGVTDGMVPDTGYRHIPVYGDVTGYDFQFVMPSSHIAGHLTDDYGTPIPDIHVWAAPDQGGPGFEDITNEFGFYNIGVIPGDYAVGVDSYDLIPDYLVPESRWVTVEEGDSLNHDFTAYTTDATISGHVYWDGNPAPDLNVGAWSEVGWTESLTDASGYYELSVSSAGDWMGYYISIWDELPPAVVVENWPSGITSGETDVDIYLSTVSGGVEGMVFDEETGDPIPWAWVHAWNDTIGDYGTGTDESGYYYLPLPNDSYMINAGAEGYPPSPPDSVYISDNVVYHDFYLMQMGPMGSLAGSVYDDGGNPIEGAEVNISGEMGFWETVWTDYDGTFYLDVPYDVYDVDVWHPDYTSDYAYGVHVDEGNPDVYLEFTLNPLDFDAVIEGLVLDAESSDPIDNAMVFASGPDFYHETWTDYDGYFYLPVAAGSLMVSAVAPEYHPAPPQEVMVSEGDSLWLEFYLDEWFLAPPMIESVTDVPNDQGRQVRVIWLSGDPANDMGWQQFSIWREVAGSEPPLWDFITTVPFHGMEPYSAVVPTLVDSNMHNGNTDAYWSTFMVTAHGYEPGFFLDSAPMAGYSVDNLAPHGPMGVMANVRQHENQVELTWLSVPDEDFQHYSVYRGNSSGFQLGEPLAYTTDTVFVDAEVADNNNYYYVITATDFNGNEGEASEEVEATLLSTDFTQALPETYQLQQNYPNPFNPSTSIRFAIPEKSRVTVTVYNLLGEEITQLRNGASEAGYYTVTWNAGQLPSGMYLVRMEANQSAEGSGQRFVQTRKMMLLK